MIASVMKYHFVSDKLYYESELLRAHKPFSLRSDLGTSDAKDLCNFLDLKGPTSSLTFDPVNRKIVGGNPGNSAKLHRKNLLVCSNAGNFVVHTINSLLVPCATRI